MADVVTTQTITDTSGVKFVVKLTNFSDGTGETDVTKVDASATTFMTENGARKIAKIWFSFTYLFSSLKINSKALTMLDASLIP